MASSLLNIGQTGMGASKKALQTTTHNISNANTEGYSRQEARMETNTPKRIGSNIYGTGVHVKSVKRAHDQLVEKKLGKSITEHEFFDERNFQLNQVQDIFNEIDSDGMNKILNRFFNSFRELSNQPENQTIRSLVRDNAQLVVSDFHRIDEQLNRSVDHIHGKIGGAVEEINSYSRSIASLNKKIQELEVIGQETGDLRDQRDTAIRGLAEYSEINTYVDGKGRQIVNFEGIGTLVAGGEIQELKAAVNTTDSSDATQRESLEVYFKDKPSAPISYKFKSGKIGALFRVRDEDIASAREDLNKLASGLVAGTNALHRRGFANKKLPVDEMGRPFITGDVNQVTNIDFFKAPKNPANALAQIELSDAIKSDVNNIATGLEPNKPGDNRVAIAISKLQHEKMLGGGTTTLEEKYLNTVGEIGLKASKNNLDLEQSSGLLAQAKSVKERISGVSLDEETANMVKYQHAYEASARVIKVANEMFDEVIGLMR